MTAATTSDLSTWPAAPLRAAIEAAERIVDGTPDPLAAATAVRSAMPLLTPAQATAILDQAGLRALARSRYHLEPGSALLTRDGLEQATRPEVAAYRAALLVRAGARRVVDLTAGLGFDASAFLAAGLEVTAVERDPATAGLCRHNLPEAIVVQGDATDPAVLADLLAGLNEQDVVFVDPARRDPGAARDLASGRARPERDPERWSPPLSFLVSIPHPRVTVKAAPAFTPPAGWHAAWSSVDRVLVECAAYSWPAFAASRRSVIHATSGPIELDSATDGGELIATADALGPWLIEPDPAVTRAGSFAALASLLGCQLERIDDDSTWLTSADEPRADEVVGARTYRVIEHLPGSTTQQRRALRARSIERLTVKSRDVKADPARVLRALGCREGSGPVLILTRRGGRTISVLADPVPVQRG